MKTLRLAALTLGGVLGLNAPLLAQVYELPGPPPDRSPLVAWIISALLFMTILSAAFKSCKRSQQD